MKEIVKKAIENCRLLLNGDITVHIQNEDGGTDYHGEVNKLYNEDLEIVLNLIEKQQAEIEKKDKMINEMIGYIAELDVDEDICKNVDCDEYTDEETGDINCKHCIKQYFERKIEQ